MGWKKTREYDELINTERWRKLRDWKLASVKGLCEQCIKDGQAAGVKQGYLTPAYLVHHIVPVETGKTRQEMERLCYDPKNLMALCKKCHGRMHKELNSQTKEGHQRTAQASLERFKERIKRKRDESEGR